MEWLVILGVSWFAWKTYSAKQKKSFSMQPQSYPAIHRPSTMGKPKKEREEELHIDIPPEYEAALSAIENGENIFISGPAGTGKSTFLKLLRQKYASKNMVVLAPTGVAALNAGGQTIHSFFKFKTHILRPEHIKKNSREAYKKIDILFIDEISMVRADIFDAINTFLKLNGPNENLPFGGVQIILIGDLFQLPPVVTRQEYEVFNTLYKTPFFFSARAFEEGDFKGVEFKKIYRQTNREFINLLNKTRTGTISESLLQALNTRQIQNVGSEEAVMAKEPVILTGRNATADRINRSRLDEIDAPSKLYMGTITGKFNIAEDKLPAPMELTLKKGARVMFTKNHPGRLWVNGTLGVVEKLSDETIYVKTGSGLHNLSRDKWETIRYNFNEEKNKWEPEVVGSYTQFPLMLAWAITIHKSQGKTLESCLVDLDGGAFADGQVYVALSRCKTFENLFLQQPIKVSDIRASKEVKQFMQSKFPE